MNQTSARTGAFTLVEMLVAIAVLSILLAVVFVPLRLAINSFHVGKARTETQNAAQASLDDMERDFRRAVYVFPNTALAGVTDNAGSVYQSNGRLPYTKSITASDTVTPGNGVCDKSAGAVPFANTSRVEMILARRANGRPVTPPQPDDTVVCYYARRQRIDLPYNPVDNPIVLFRAEFLYGNAVPAPAPAPAGSLNADISPSRFPTSCSSKAVLNRQSLWLEHNVYGEANLEPVTEAGNGKGVQTMAIPRGIGLVASQAYKLDQTLSPPPTPPTNQEAPLVPDTSFQLSDTNGDGKIDQVKASLALETFDANQSASTGTNGQTTGQIVRARRTFDLPNVR